MKHPDVSVVIPTRDRLHFLQRAVTCATRQRDVTVEVVVVDDGSTDGTADWLSANRDGVRTVCHDSSRGLAQARNAGIAECRGIWVAFLDDDDVWSPNKVAAQLQAAVEVEAAWAYSAVVLVDEDLKARQLMPFPEPADVRRRILASQVIPAGSSNVVVRRRALDRVGVFDEKLAHLADWDLWTRLALDGPVGGASDVLVGYVEHDHNMHAGPDLDSTFAELDYLELKHRQAREEAGVRIDVAAFVRWAAWGHRRAGRRWRASALHARGAVERRDVRELKEAARALLGTRPLRWWTTERPPEPEWLALYR
ncbi:MAG: glycosyltransferase family 2 protein [Acidimicrobiia bacterium]